MGVMKNVVELAKSGDSFSKKILVNKFIKIYLADIDEIKSKLSKDTYNFLRSIVAVKVNEDVNKYLLKDKNFSTVMYSEGERCFKLFINAVANNTTRGINLRLIYGDKKFYENIIDIYYEKFLSIIDNYNFDKDDRDHFIKISYYKIKDALDDYINNIINGNDRKKSNLYSYMNVTLDKLTVLLDKNVASSSKDFKNEIRNDNIDNYIYYNDKFRYIVDDSVMSISDISEEERNKLKLQGYKVLGDAIFNYAYSGVQSSIFVYVYFHLKHNFWTKINHRDGKFGSKKKCEENSAMYDDIRNGNQQSKDVLVSIYLYLVDDFVGNLSFDDEYKNIIKYEGYERLRELVFKYFDGNKSVSFENYVKTGLRGYFSYYINKSSDKSLDFDNYIYLNEHYRYIVDFAVDCIDDISIDEKNKLKKDGYSLLGDAIINYYKVDRKTILSVYVSNMIRKNFIRKLEKKYANYSYVSSKINKGKELDKQVLNAKNGDNGALEKIYLLLVGKIDDMLDMYIISEEDKNILKSKCDEIVRTNINRYFESPKKSSMYSYIMSKLYEVKKTIDGKYDNRKELVNKRK